MLLKLTCLKVSTSLALDIPKAGWIASKAGLPNFLNQGILIALVGGAKFGINPYKNHSFDNIENHCAEEKDAAWGLENLHNIRPKLEKVSRNPREILGSFLVDYYNKFNLVFWWIFSMRL